jgi:hypothetical protein
MSTLARLYDFTAGQPILSAEVDGEFNQIVNALNSTSTTKNIIVRFSDGTTPPLKLDQLGLGRVQEWAVGGVTLLYIANSGQLVSSIATGTAPISVTSTTVCTNLNADKLDGKGLFTGDVVGIVQALNPRYDTVGNSAGSGDTTLHTRIFSESTLPNDGAYLNVRMGGTIAANANNKRIRVTFGGTAILDTGTLSTLNNLNWFIDLVIIRIDSDSVRAIGTFTTKSSVTDVFATYVQVNSLSFSGTLTLSLVANGVAANDIVQQVSTFEVNQMQ